MKTIIMDPTIGVICKKPEDLEDLKASGFEQKETEDGVIYLIKEETLN